MSTKPSPELLPCPFCGCTTIVKATGPRATVPFYECDWCDAEGPAEEPEADPPQGWNVRATPAALAASPEVQAMIREAEARGMERAANMVAMAPLAHLPHSPGAVAFFSDPTKTLNNAADAIRAEAAALRGKETT